jgi:hypothetical protein
MSGIIWSNVMLAVVPVVTGAGKIMVGANAGAWRNGPLSIGYRWQRYQKRRWRTISGATKQAYLPTRRDGVQPVIIWDAVTGDEAGFFPAVFCWKDGNDDIVVANSA